MRVGFIGLGTMGSRMSANLLEAGHTLVIHDLDPAAGEALVERGAAWAVSPAAVAGQVEVVFTSLPGPPQVEAVALSPNGIIGGALPGLAFFDLSTNSPTVMRRIHAELSPRGVHVFDAPVSGGPDGAATGRLAIWVGGDPDAFEAFLPVLRSFSDAPHLVGPVGAGSVAKLVHNASGYIIQTALAETFTLGVKAGVDPESLWQAVRMGALGRRRTFDTLSRNFLPGRFDPPDFALELARKDVALACELGREFDVPMRLANLTLMEMTEAMNRGWARRDSRSTMLLQEERSGVEVRIPAERIAEILDAGTRKPTEPEPEPDQPRSWFDRAVTRVRGKNRPPAVNPADEERPEPGTTRPVPPITPTESPAPGATSPARSPEPREQVKPPSILDDGTPATDRPTSAPGPAPGSETTKPPSLLDGTTLPAAPQQLPVYPATGEYLKPPSILDESSPELLGLGWRGPNTGGGKPPSLLDPSPDDPLADPRSDNPELFEGSRPAVSGESKPPSVIDELLEELLVDDGTTGFDVVTVDGAAADGVTADVVTAPSADPGAVAPIAPAPFDGTAGQSPADGAAVELHGPGDADASAAMPDGGAHVDDVSAPSPPAPPVDPSSPTTAGLSPTGHSASTTSPSAALDSDGSGVDGPAADTSPGAAVTADHLSGPDLSQTGDVTSGDTVESTALSWDSNGNGNGNGTHAPAATTTNGPHQLTADQDDLALASTITAPLEPRADGPTTPNPDATPAVATPEGAQGWWYGWTVVSAVFIILMVTSGLGFYNVSVILKAAVDELDAKVGAVSGGAAMFFGISGITAFLLARRMEKVDLRWFYLAGGLFGAGALYGLQWVRNVLELYLFFAVFGIGFAMCGLVPGITLVTRWFQARRSIAISIASTGLSMGGIALTPVSGRLIEVRQLDGAAPILALIWLVGVIPIGLLLIRSFPSDKGLGPDGVPLAVATANRPVAPVRLPGASFVAARRTRFFVMMCLAYALIFFSQVGGLAHLYSIAAERTDKATASVALSLLALTSVVGRLLGGVIVLKVPTKAFSMILVVLQALALTAISLSFTPVTILASAVFLGVSVGNLLMLQPLLLAEAFGVAEYSRIYSFNQLFSTVGVAGGPVVLGLVHDVASYETAFVIAGIGSVLGFLAFLAAGPVDGALSLWDDAPTDEPPATAPVGVTTSEPAGATGLAGTAITTAD